METLSYAQLTQRCIELTEQRDAVVAESAGLRKAAEFATAPDMWVEQDDGMLDYRYVDWYVDVLKAAMETSATSSAVAALRAEREADKEKIATLQSRNRRLEGIITAAEKRIAELGVSLKAAEINETDARCHVAELEGRTLTVKLPPVSFFDFKLGSGFASGAYVNVEELNKELTAAGITLVVGGE